LALWALRPVSSAARVGVHSEVVWNWLKRMPSFASCSAVGVRIGPPKALGWPKPMSSINTISTFGALAGAWTRNSGGGVTLRALISVIGGYCGSTIGSTVRSRAMFVAVGAAKVSVGRTAARLSTATPAPRRMWVMNVSIMSLLFCRW
jgi:hypothetical protein